MVDSALFFLYHLFWTLFAAPLLAFARCGKNAYLAEKLALNLPVCNLQKGSLWVHALSVGEVLSAVPLVHALRARSPRRSLVFTATTTQGLEIARKELGDSVDCLFRMPLDFWFSMRSVVRFVQPRQMIIVETDLWPGYLRILKRSGAGTLLVNSRISPRTFRGYRIAGLLVRRMLFAYLDKCLMQSELDSRRLADVGIPPEKIVTAGNIKFDREWPPMNHLERERLAASLGLVPEAPLWVAGSTHPGEEEIVLEVFMRLRSPFPNLKLIIAPRRIEESAVIMKSAREKGLNPVLRTDLARERSPFDLLVLNTIGELGGIYALCRVAFVGGSLVDEGGHNLLEPASHGCPVLFGTYMHSFVSMSQSLIEAGGGRQVEDGGGLLKAMEELLTDTGKAEEMGRRARTFAESNRGALERVLAHISAGP
ncbi:MAG: 3-deoxy-D-manno-octulosonic acid transferase [Desulfobacteraceae bacterium]|nr:MAG: 3-deoxy-D-manno-octulosonic acid transferase [Desulfobacteraceae bacterium]